MDTVWSAYDFVNSCIQDSVLAQKHNFVVFPCQGLDGFVDGLLESSHNCIVGVSDDTEGTIELNPTPQMRRMQNVFLAVRVIADDAQSHRAGMDLLRQLFRVLVSRLLQVRQSLTDFHVVIEPRISFSEIPNGINPNFACAFFSIVTDTFPDMSYKEEDWINPLAPLPTAPVEPVRLPRPEVPALPDNASYFTVENYVDPNDCELWAMGYDDSSNNTRTHPKLGLINFMMRLTGLHLREAKKVVDTNLPYRLLSGGTLSDLINYKSDAEYYCYYLLVR